MVLGVAITVPIAGAVASTDRHASRGMAQRFLPWSFIADRVGHPVGPRSTTRPPRPHGPTTTVAFASHPRRRTSSATRRPPAPPADLRLTITAPSRVRQGAIFSYTIQVANHGPATPSEVTVRNMLPKGVTRTGAVVPKGVGGYAGGQQATLVLPRIAVGRSVVVALKVRANRGTHGTVTAHGAIVYTAGVRLIDPRHATARATTRVG